MAFDDPGRDTVVLIRRPAQTTRRLPTDPEPAQSQRITKADCCQVEIQRPVEDLDLATINSEIAWIFLPAEDPDALALTPADAIEYRGRTYEMQGPPAIETVEGEMAPIWCTTKWERG